MKFDLRQTNISKGVAVCFLLWHHLFFNNPSMYKHYVSLLVFDGIPAEAMISDICKVCVAVFLILSGYGMHKSYKRCLEKSSNKGIRFDLNFIRYRLLKLYIPFWMVFIIFVPLGLLLGRNYDAVYGSNPVNGIIDFFGLSFLFHGSASNTANAAWWYMSIIVVFCVLYPVLHRFVNYSAELAVSSAFLLCFLDLPLREYNVWLLPFVFGIYISERDLFEKTSKLLSTDFTRLLSGLFLIVAFILIRNMSLNDTRFDFAFGTAVILFTFWCTSKIPVLNKVLEELGKKSGLIFFVHSFIYSMYFARYVYFFKYPVLIFIVLLVISYIVAWMLQKLIDLTRVNKLNRI